MCVCAGTDAGFRAEMHTKILDNVGKLFKRREAVKDILITRVIMFIRHLRVDCEW